MGREVEEGKERWGGGEEMGESKEGESKEREG